MGITGLKGRQNMETIVVNTVPSCYKNHYNEEFKRMFESFNKLVGRKVVDIILSSDKQIVEFVCEDFKITFSCDSDCCSETWIEDFDNRDFLIGKTINKVEIIPMEDTYEYSGDYEPHEDNNCHWVYGVKFFSNAGIADLIFRNASNGYYGGWLSECK